MTFRGWGTQRGFILRDMYLSVGFFVGRGTQEGLTLRNKYLTVGFLVGILKFIRSHYTKTYKGIVYILHNEQGGRRGFANDCATCYFNN